MIVDIQDDKGTCPHPHCTVENEREDSTLPPPLVVESKFTVKRPCWKPRFPSNPVCVSSLEQWETKVHPIGRHLGGITAVKWEASTTCHPDTRQVIGTSSFLLITRRILGSDVSIWILGLRDHSLLRSQSVHLRPQTALSKRSQGHVTAASSEQRGRKTGRSIKIQIN